MKSDLIGKKFPVLDNGHVILLDYMGSDHSIAQAARTSYGKGTKSVSDDTALIRYLLRHHHSSPVEQAELQFHVRVPMDTWRQWIRHRTANVNEYSTRYSEAIDRTAITGPDEWRLQSTVNKQGSEKCLEDWPEGVEIDDGFREPFKERWPEPGPYLSMREQVLHEEAMSVYKERLALGVAREQARKDLPLSTYTEAIWKMDLSNLLHFLSLRMDSHSQKEIRDYSDVIGYEIVSKLFPITFQAFIDYRLEAMQLTRLDIWAIANIQRGVDRDTILETVFNNKRERQECLDKLNILGIG